MTREELLNSILESTGTAFCRSIDPEDLVAEAYNRAIDDAIRHSRIEMAANYGRYEDDPKPEFKVIDKRTYAIVSYGHGDCSYTAIRVANEELEKLKIK